MSRDPKRRHRSPEQLPPGRHGLPRSFVVHNQRERILAAVAEVCAEVGYADMRVEDVVIAAGVSRRTFYDHFGDKQAAFLATYDDIIEELFGLLEAAFEREKGFVARTSACLAELVDFLSAEPAYATMCVVEVLAAGSEAVGRRNAAMNRFAAIISRGAEELPKKARPPILTAETLVGGIYEVVYARVLQHDLDELDALMPDLVYSVLLPYVGVAEAGAEATRLRKRRSVRS